MSFNSSGSKMEDQLFAYAHYLMTVDMIPVFFTAHFLLASILVRDDSKDLGPKFRQNHPFAMWFCTIIAGLSGVFVANFLFGEPLIDIMKENFLIAFLTVIWYLVNYCPFDLVYKVSMLQPVILTAAMLQECLRVRFIYLGLQQAAQIYPNALIIILLGGVIKGNGYGFIKIVEQLIRGKWAPSSNEILEVTYFAKSGLYASLAFLLHHIKVILIPIEFLYAGVVGVFIVFRMMIMIFKVKDPLLPLETPFCAVFFGSGPEVEDKKKGKIEKEDTKGKNEDGKIRNGKDKKNK